MKISEQKKTDSGHTRSLGRRGGRWEWACGMLICYLCHHYWVFLSCFFLSLKQKASRLLVWSAKFFPLYYMESRETQFFFFENTSIFRGKRVTTHTASDFFYVSDSFPSFLLISGERPFTSLLENVALKDKKIFKGVVTNKDFETVLGKSTTRIVVAPTTQMKSEIQKWQFCCFLISLSL